MNKGLEQNLELKEITRKIVGANYGNPVVTEILKNAATMSKTPMILELKTAHNNIHDATNTHENVVLCNSTAEAMNFELLLEGNETSDVLAKSFLNDAHKVPDKPSYEELEGAFSRVLSQETYEGFPEFLENFNESGLENLKQVSHHIILEHPQKTDNGYVGKIGIDSKCKQTNQYSARGLLEICKYRLTD